MSNAGNRLIAAAVLATIVVSASSSGGGAAEPLDDRQMPKAEEQYTELFGSDLYKRGLYPEALAVWSHAFKAKQDAGAAYELGISYLDANVVKQDVGKALGYLRASAFRGDMRAQFELGSIYDNGEVVPADRSLAAIWYFAASMHDDPGAEFNLASLYETGEGVEADPTMAYAYYSLAIAHGFPDNAVGALQRISARMTEAERREAITMTTRIQASRSASFGLDRGAGAGAK